MKSLRGSPARASWAQERSSQFPSARQFDESFSGFYQGILRYSHCRSSIGHTPYKRLAMSRSVGLRDLTNCRAAAKITKRRHGTLSLARSQCAYPQFAPRDSSRSNYAVLVNGPTRGLRSRRLQLGLFKFHCQPSTKPPCCSFLSCAKIVTATSSI